MRTKEVQAYYGSFRVVYATLEELEDALYDALQWHRPTYIFAEDADFDSLYEKLSDLMPDYPEQPDEPNILACWHVGYKTVQVEVDEYFTGSDEPFIAVFENDDF